MKATREVVLERIETLAKIRLEKLNWDEGKTRSLQDLLEAAYLDGARDALDYLGMVLEGEAKA